MRRSDFKSSRQTTNICYYYEMRQVVLAAFASFMMLVMGTSLTFATSQRAYEDYLFQSDVYRQKYNEFEIAKNEFLKFGTLTSQTAALEKTRNMLSQRDLLLRSYLLILTERLDESSHMDPSTKALYRTLLNNEIQFLDNHSLLIESVNDIEDAENVSSDLEEHYTILQKTIRQTIIALAVADLEDYGKRYDSALLLSRELVRDGSESFSIQKQATIDRWILQITNKRTLFQRRIDEVKAVNAAMKETSLPKIITDFNEMQASLTNAKQELTEGSSFLRELLDTLRYKE